MSYSLLYLSAFTVVRRLVTQGLTESVSRDEYVLILNGFLCFERSDSSLLTNEGSRGPNFYKNGPFLLGVTGTKVPALSCLLDSHPRPDPHLTCFRSPLGNLLEVCWPNQGTTCHLVTMENLHVAEKPAIWLAS